MEVQIRLTRVTPEPFPVETIERHVAGLRALDDEGRLIAAGPLADGSGGLILARFSSLAEAEAFAAADPYVADGYEVADVRDWLHAERRNGYLLGGD